MYMQEPPTNQSSLLYCIHKKISTNASSVAYGLQANARGGMPRVTRLSATAQASFLKNVSKFFLQIELFWFCIYLKIVDCAKVCISWLYRLCLFNLKLLHTSSLCCSWSLVWFTSSFNHVLRIDHLGHLLSRHTLRSCKVIG